MPKILDISAHKIVNSRGNYTIQTKITLDNGIEATAAVPEGASKGKNEAMSFPVNKALEMVNTAIRDLLIDEDIDNQEKIDNLMLTMDGTSNKRNLGGNSILSVSLACARACSITKGIPLYFYISQIYDDSKNFHKMIVEDNNFPTPIFNILNGGVHAANNLSFQEFMVIPSKKYNFEEAYDMGVTIYQDLKKILLQEGMSTAIGDEGGFAPQGLNIPKAFELLKAASQKNFKVGKEVYFGSDVASGSFFHDGKYFINESDLKLDGPKLKTFYEALLEKYPIIYLEDPFEETDIKNWQKTGDLQEKILISGDDLVVTNSKYLDSAIRMGLINSVIVKPNQIGTLTETLNFIRLAKKNKLMTVISHRSGDVAEDSFISDLAVGVGSEFIKSGAPARGERVAKYNRILDIFYEIRSM
jgi:enolase